MPGVLLATLWWIVPLLMLGIHGENFMPYVEQAETIQIFTNPQNQLTEDYVSGRFG